MWVQAELHWSVGLQSFPWAVPLEPPSSVRRMFSITSAALFAHHTRPGPNANILSRNQIPTFWCSGHCHKIQTSWCWPSIALILVSASLMVCSFVLHGRFVPSPMAHRAHLFELSLGFELSRLDRIFRGGLLSLPGIPVFLGGCTERTVTMEVIEFGNWLKTTGEPFPAQTWETLISSFISDPVGGTFRGESCKIPLPERLRNPQTEKSWKSGGWTSPCGVQAVNADTERSLIVSPGY
jgi:hypothetical protein